MDQCGDLAPQRHTELALVPHAVHHCVHRMGHQLLVPKRRLARHHDSGQHRRQLVGQLWSRNDPAVLRFEVGQVGQQVEVVGIWYGRHNYQYAQWLTDLASTLPSALCDVFDQLRLKIDMRVCCRFIHPPVHIARQVVVLNVLNMFCDRLEKYAIHDPIVPLVLLL